MLSIGCEVGTVPALSRIVIEDQQGVAALQQAGRYLFVFDQYILAKVMIAALNTILNP